MIYKLSVALFLFIMTKTVSGTESSAALIIQYPHDWYLPKMLMYTYYMKYKQTISSLVKLNLTIKINWADHDYSFIGLKSEGYWICWTKTLIVFLFINFKICVLKMEFLWIYYYGSNIWEEGEYWFSYNMWDTLWQHRHYLPTNGIRRACRK